MSSYIQPVHEQLGCRTIMKQAKTLFLCVILHVTQKCAKKTRLFYAEISIKK